MTGSIGHNGGPPLDDDLTALHVARLRGEIGRLERTAAKAADAATDSARRDRGRARPGTSRWRRADQIWMNEARRTEEQAELAKRGPQIERLRRKLARLEQQRD